MTPPPFEALILCATARSGSTLLCSLLESSGVAGRPQSWYRAQDRNEFATAWSLPRDANGRWFPADYSRAALAAGRSPNGVFGLRLMHDTLPALLAELRMLHPRAAGDADLLARAFGRPTFVHLSRVNRVAQAVSRLKAEQTGLWHLAEDWEERLPGSPAHYDRNRIAAFAAEAEAGDAAWTDWFATNNVRPATLLYEDLACDPVGVASALIAELGLREAASLAIKTHRLADAESVEWIARFGREAAVTPPAPSDPY